MRSAQFRVAQLFRLIPGYFHAKSELEAGTVPLVSCGYENNGLIGRYDIADEHTHHRALTVAFNGTPLTTNFHPYKFGAKDDVAVLVPIKPMANSLLIYTAALLNAKRWRYSYGRKCYREKLNNVSLVLPVDGTGKSLAPEVADRFLAESLDRIRATAKDSLDALVME